MKYLILLFTSILLLSSCNKQENTLTSTTTINNTPKVVTYKISCNDCSVFWKNENGEELSETNQDSSWEYSFNGKTGDLLQLWVMNTQDTYGYTNVSILLNNEILNSCNSGCPINGVAMALDTLQ